MGVTIKTATIDDLKAVQALNWKLFEKEQAEYDPLLNMDWTFGEVGTKYYQDRISRDDGCVFVAVVDNQIVGYLCGGLTQAEEYRNLPIVAEFENTFVLDEFRSQGIGKQMYKEFIKWCKSKGVGKVRAEASAENDRAIKFYRDNGFVDHSLILEMDL